MISVMSVARVRHRSITSSEKTMSTLTPLPSRCCWTMRSSSLHAVSTVRKAAAGSERSASASQAASNAPPAAPAR